MIKIKPIELFKMVYCYNFFSFDLFLQYFPFFLRYKKSSALEEQETPKLSPPKSKVSINSFFFFLHSEVINNSGVFLMETDPGVKTALYLLSHRASVCTAKWFLC